MRHHLRATATAACALALSGICAASGRATPAGAVPGPGLAHAGTAAGRPAIWRTYDMIVSFQKLPRTYTCDQLWYELHGILRRLGAPPSSINILPYDCSPSPGGDMKSPNVQVRFQLPFVLQPGVTGAPIEAVAGTVRLSPGDPKTLHASDCQLLQQIEQTLFATMPVKVDAAHFACSAPPSRSGEFAVTLTLPVVASARAAAAASSSAAPAPR